MKIFLTGRPGIGKSTVIQRIVEEGRKHGLKITGFVTPEIIKGKSRFGFLVKDILSEKGAELATIKYIKDAPKVSKYFVDIEKFNEIAIAAIMREAEIVCIDEIGKMEMFSEKFKEKLMEFMKSDIQLIATVGKGYIKKFKKFGKIIEVTIENRENLPLEIINMIK